MYLFESKYIYIDVFCPLYRHFIVFLKGKYFDYILEGKIVMRLTPVQNLKLFLDLHDEMKVWSNRKALSDVEYNAKKSFKHHLSLLEKGLKYENNS
jgi:glutaredoxin-related protein